MLVWMTWALWAYEHAPAKSWVRLCGNCYASGVIVPVEMGVVGFLLATASVLGMRWRREHAVEWCGAAVGILLTPIGLGAPLFAVSALMLLVPLLSTSDGAL
jgi:hypothetical protein